MNRVPTRSTVPARAPLAALALLLVGVSLSACEDDNHKPGHSSSRRAAMAMVNNPAPGQGPLAPMLAGPPEPQSGEGMEVAQSALSSGTGGALVLYDTTGPYGWLGELYATATVNLASHFGSWTAKPVASYAAGDMSAYTATIYIGSTYDEPLPRAWRSLELRHKSWIAC